jgi:hypothetical protein
MVRVLRTCPETTMRICFDDEREGGADIAFLVSNRAEAVRVWHLSHWRPQIAGTRGRAGQSRADAAFSRFLACALDKQHRWTMRGHRTLQTMFVQD